MSAYKAQIITSLKDISEKVWNAVCYNDHTRHNPFISHQFLSALEDSGCAKVETGWQAQHIIIRNQEDIVVGIMPLYLKSHSYGEYVFDHAWANAYRQAGGHYYPKLQSSIPFTPVTCSKLMVLSHENEKEIQNFILRTALSHANILDVSSLHVTFTEQEEWDIYHNNGLLQREDQQFHWLNEGYVTFEDFLMALTSRKRKNIRKERKQALSNDIEIEILSGKDITEEHWDDYFTFYLDTSNRKWGQPYLNRDFFSLLWERMADRTLLIMCKRQNRYIAGALNLLGDDVLYGRYWGAVEEHKYLHFEVCYYQAIEYAIKHGLKKIEAGAQGEHKLARGYVPVSTYSAHWIKDPGFRKAISDYLHHERKMVQQDQNILSTFVPFKKK